MYIPVLSWYIAWHHVPANRPRFHTKPSPAFAWSLGGSQTYFYPFYLSWEILQRSNIKHVEEWRNPRSCRYVFAFFAVFLGFRIEITRRRALARNILFIVYVLDLRFWPPSYEVYSFFVIPPVFCYAPSTLHISIPLQLCFSGFKCTF